MPDAMPSPPSRFDVITLGESMVLFAAEVPGALEEVEQFRRHLAGAETNVAIGLARLGLRTAWVSRLGTDVFGDFVLDRVRREGVECSHVRRDPVRATGFMLKSRELQGRDPRVAYFRRGSAASALSLQDFDEDFFASARHLHVSGITPALSPTASHLVAFAMDFMRRRGRTVSFDPNLRPGLWQSREHMLQEINRLAALADWVLPGLEEGRTLTGLQLPADIAAFYLRQGAQAVVLKHGAQGASFHTATREGHVPGVTVPRVVDTVGAGDGFAAGVLSARLQGLDWPQALARGNWIGARALQVAGDMDGLPHHHELPPQEVPA
jgi:sugar/nucleoside kinase (ribokinase family)